MPPSFSARYELPVWTLVAMVVVTAAPSAAGADEGPDEPRRVVMASDVQAFTKFDDGAEFGDEHRQAIERGAVDQWRQTEVVDVDVVDGDGLRDAVTGDSLYDGTLELARQWGEMGIEAYNQLRTQEAVDYLERSLDNFHQIGHHLIAPAEVSEIKMYLALSYLEDGIDVVRPLEVLQEMIRRYPDRRLESGYYPDFIVQYYQNARESLFSRLRSDGPPAGESQRLAEFVDGHYVFHGYAVPESGEAVELVAYLYDVEGEEFLDPERIVVESTEPIHLEEGFSRLASRLANCLVEPGFDEDDDTSELAASLGTSPLSVQMGLYYGSFLQIPSPILEPFGNYGLKLGAGWSLTREFQLVASLKVSNSMRDYAGTLRENFTAIRAMVGGELGRDVGPVHLSVATGIEAARIGTIRAFTDRSCIPDPERLCPGDAGTEVFDDIGIHWGMHVSPQIGWRLSDSLKVISSVDISYYFSPLDDRIVNFPVATEVGVRYRF